MKGTLVKIGKHYAVGQSKGHRDRVKILSFGGSTPGTWRVEYDSRATEVLPSRDLKDFWDDEVIAKTRIEVQDAARMARLIAEDTAKKTALEALLPAFRGIMVTLAEVGISSNGRDEELDLADVLQDFYGKHQSATISIGQPVFEKVGKRIEQLSLEQKGAYWS